MNDTTAIIVIKGSPPYLEKSLSSIDKSVTEIIIGTVDADKTLVEKLKKNKKVVIVPLDPEIPFADVVKEDLKKLARGKYILYIDPDEIFPEKAIGFIMEKIKEYDYFYLPRKNYFFGKWMRHTRWWPDRQLRFFKKESVVWPKVIHPVPAVSGKGLELPAEEDMAIVHYNYDNLGHYFEKSLRYARSEAKSLAAGNRHLTLAETFNKSLNEFISRYFADEGYRDGSHGFVMALLQMFYYVLVYVFYWEEKKYFDIDGKTAARETGIFFLKGFRETAFWSAKKDLAGNKDRTKFRLLNKIINFFGL